MSITTLPLPWLLLCRQFCRRAAPFYSSAAELINTRFSERNTCLSVPNFIDVNLKTKEKKKIHIARIEKMYFLRFCQQHGGGGGCGGGDGGGCAYTKIYEG